MSDTEVASTSEAASTAGSIVHVLDDAPPLIRTDSIFLTKAMLGYKTDDSITSIDNSEDGYVPGPSGSSEEDDSDEFSEPKTRVDSSKHVDLVSEGDSSDKLAGVKRNKQYKKTIKRCRSSSEENSSNGESELKRKKRYENTYKSPPKSNTSSESLLVMNVSEVDGSKKYHQNKFCEQPQSNFARHLEHKHGDEMEIATALQSANKSKARRLQLNLLRKKGNRAHNIQALKEGKGVLVPCKQTSDDKSNHQDYQHCFACHGLFKRKSMWRHVARCTLAQNVRKEMPGKTRIQALCASAQPVTKGVSEKVWKLVSNMAQDDVAHAVKEDRYILALGEKMYNKKGENPSQEMSVIRAKQPMTKGKLEQKRGSHEMDAAATDCASESDSEREESSEKSYEGNLTGEMSAIRAKQPMTKGKLGQKRGSHGAKGTKRYWSTIEVDAVEDSLMNFIRMGKTPGKQDCEKCIAASPQALVNRDWRAVKFYVHNRIIADQRK